MTLTYPPYMFVTYSCTQARQWQNGTNIGGTRRLNPLQILGWEMAAALLLTPLMTMQFTDEVD